MAKKENKTGKKPYIPLYIGDWEQDTNMLSLEAEGGWLKIIFKMWKEKNSVLQTATRDLQGIYTISTNALQKLWRKNQAEIEEIIKELIDAKICNLTICDGYYTFGNRRMIREAQLSGIRANAVQKRYKKYTKGGHPSEAEAEIDSKKGNLKTSKNSNGKADHSEVKLIAAAKNTEEEKTWSKTVAATANAVWKDQAWKEATCQARSVTMKELQVWLANFNSSLAKPIPDWDIPRYKRMSRGWIAHQQDKGVTVQVGVQKKDSPTLETISHHGD